MRFASCRECACTTESPPERAGWRRCMRLVVGEGIQNCAMRRKRAGRRRCFVPRYRCPSPSSPECGAEGIAVKEGYSRLRESIQMVTGPSLMSSTCMSAPKTPVATGRPRSSASRSRRADVRRAIALLRGGHQRELADGQDFASDLPNVEIHHPLCVVEDTESGTLAYQPFDVLYGIFIRYAHQNEHAGAYPRNEFIPDGD